MPGNQAMYARTTTSFIHFSLLFATDFPTRNTPHPLQRRQAVSFRPSIALDHTAACAAVAVEQPDVLDCADESCEPPEHEEVSALADEVEPEEAPEAQPACRSLEQTCFWCRHRFVCSATGVGFEEFSLSRFIPGEKQKTQATNNQKANKKQAKQAKQTK